MASDTPARAVKIDAPRGRVPYVVISPSEFAFANCLRGTRFGMLASLAGVHRSDRHSMRNEMRKMGQSPGRNGIDAYMTPRPTSDPTMSLRRSKRSANTPAKGPNSTEGRSLASITPATARGPTSSPCLHCGHVTPVLLGGSFLMYLHSG